MNAARRKRLDYVTQELEAIRAEEQEAFDNLPEGIQESPRGEQMESALDALEQAISSIEEATDASC